MSIGGGGRVGGLLAAWLVPWSACLLGDKMRPDYEPFFHHDSPLGKDWMAILLGKIGIASKQAVVGNDVTSNTTYSTEHCRKKPQTRGPISRLKDSTENDVSTKRGLGNMVGATGLRKKEACYHVLTGLRLVAP